ncbi:MAG: SecD export rane protein [Bacteroidetes bacterium]|nr:SecD export rane protein [Bacteroidota bacterium]
MRKYSFKITLIAASVLLALYFLYPTYRDYQLHKEMAAMSAEDSLSFYEQNEQEIRDNRQKRIKLGLDLQGGMRVVLEVHVLKLIEDLAKNKDEAFAQIMKEVRDEASLTLRDDNDRITGYLEDEATKAIDRGMEIVRNRVDQYGVSEPNVQKLGGTRIIVELPGVSREAEVRQLLQGTALLEFKLLKEPEIAYRVMEAIDQALAAVTDTTDTASVAASTDTTKIATPEGDMTPEEFRKKHPFFGIAIVNPQQFPGEAVVAEENREKVRRMLEREEVRRVIPNDIQFVWSAKSRLLGEGQRYYTLYPVKSTPELTGGVITTARATLDPVDNLPIVTMEMNGEGAREWSRITGANINKRIAIVLDNAVFSAPVVRGKIPGGHSQIEGMDNLEEARLLEIVLKAGALPAPVEIIEQRSVGPSLGEDSIRAGLLSSLVATALTMIFMLIYYRTGGTVATVALLLCLLFLLGVLAAFQGTLTLPGIAGIILTLAVAVDANVLIYERIREELLTGKTLRAAIDAGYDKAWSAIFDSNLTTFFSGVILWQFGSGPVQGFALTLMIGIAASMFSAIFITRVLFYLLTDSSKIKLNFG